MSLYYTCYLTVYRYRLTNHCYYTILCSTLMFAFQRPSTNHISYSNIVSYIKLAIYIVHRLINHYYYTILYSTSMVTLRFTYNICKYCIISPYYMSYHTVLPTLYNYIHISFVQYCSIRFHLFSHIVSAAIWLSRSCNVINSLFV